MVFKKASMVLVTVAMVVMLTIIIREVEAVRNQTGPDYDQLALWGELGSLACDENVFFPQAGSWDPWEGDINDLADTPLYWEDYTTYSLDGTFSENYETVLGNVEANELNADCLLYAISNYKNTSGVFWYNRTAEYEDFITLYERGWINVNKTLESSGVVVISNTTLEYSQIFTVGAFLRIDVEPNGWFNPSVPYYFQDAPLNEPECGEDAKNAWDCYFSPTRGIFNTIVTGLLVAADVRSNVTYSDGERVFSATQSGVPTLVALVGRQLPWRAPFCGVPVPPV